MKRYLIHMETRGFEFQTEHFINSKEFWDELARADYFRIGEGIYKPLTDTNITGISLIGYIR